MKYLCYAALADLFKYLPETKANPQALDVRQKLQLASWMSLWPIKIEKYRYASTHSCTLRGRMLTCRGMAVRWASRTRSGTS